MFFEQQTKNKNKRVNCDWSIWHGQIATRPKVPESQIVTRAKSLISSRFYRYYCFCIALFPELCSDILIPTLGGDIKTAAVFASGRR